MRGGREDDVASRPWTLAPPPNRSPTRPVLALSTSRRSRPSTSLSEVSEIFDSPAPRALFRQTRTRRATSTNHWQARSRARPRREERITGYLPEDRAVRPLSWIRDLSATRAGRYGSLMEGPSLPPRSCAEVACGYVVGPRTRTPAGRAEVRSLSGGNHRRSLCFAARNATPDILA